MKFLIILALALTGCGETKKLVKELNLGSSLGEVVEQELLENVVNQVAPQLDLSNLQSLEGETCWKLKEKGKDHYVSLFYFNEDHKKGAYYEEVLSCSDPIAIDLDFLNDRVRAIITNKEKRRAWIKDFVLNTGKKLILLKLGVPVSEVKRDYRSG